MLMLRADAHFFLVAHARGSERQALGFAFAIGYEIEQRPRSNGRRDFVALDKKQNRAASQEEDDECDAALHHRTFLSSSRCRA